MAGRTASALEPIGITEMKEVQPDISAMYLQFSAFQKYLDMILIS